MIQIGCSPWAQSEPAASRRRKRPKWRRFYTTSWDTILKERKIRVIAVSDGYDNTVKGHKIQASVRGLINEIFLDDLKEKTHRGLMGKALKGQNAGGRCFGYNHIPIEHPTRKDEYGRPAIDGAYREVAPEQAKIVVWIFEKYAEGYSPGWIADRLNRQGVRTARGGTWAQSAIHGHQTQDTGILNNQLYIGLYRWNRGEWIKDPETGNRVRRARPESDWVITELPELRIIPQELWDAVKARQGIQAEKTAKVRAARGEQARAGAGPKYLFSSLLTCKICGGAFSMIDHYRYGCSTNKYRGDSVCSNTIRVQRKVVEQVLLRSIKEDLFSPEGIAFFKDEVRRLLREQAKATGHDTERAKADRVKVDSEITNLLNAIKAGIITTSTKAELERLEADKLRLDMELAPKVNQGLLGRVEDVLPRITERFGALVANLEEVALHDVARARTALKAILGGSNIHLIPQAELKHLEAELAGDYAGMVALIAENPRLGARVSECLNLVAGAGFEPATFRL